MSKTDRNLTSRLFAREELARLGNFLRLTKYTVARPPIDHQEASKISPDGWKTVELVDVYRRDAVAGLLHFIDKDEPDQDTHSLFMVEQFRFSTTINALTGDPDLESDGVLLELMAGVCEPGEPYVETFIRETREETGFVITDDAVQYIASFYPSPGACSEQIHLYYAQVLRNPREEQRTVFGYDAQEDIRRVELPVPEFLEMVTKNQIKDAKALVAASWIWRNAEVFGLSEAE